MIVLKNINIGKHTFHIHLLFSHYKRNPTLKEVDKYLRDHLSELFPLITDYLHVPLTIGRVKALRKMCPEFDIASGKQYIDFLVQIEADNNK